MTKKKIKVAGADVVNALDTVVELAVQNVLDVDDCDGEEMIDMANDQNDSVEIITKLAETIMKFPALQDHVNKCMNQR